MRSRSWTASTTPSRAHPIWTRSWSDSSGRADLLRLEQDALAVGDARLQENVQSGARCSDWHRPLTRGLAPRAHVVVDERFAGRPANTVKRVPGAVDPDEASARAVGSEGQCRSVLMLQFEARLPAA